MGEASASPCAACGTTGGLVRATDSKPRRSDGSRFGIDGEVCFRCYDKFAKRLKRDPAASPAAKPERPALSDIDPIPYQWLVRLIAKDFLRRGMEFNDLVGYGQIGLLKACKGFDPNNGVKFDTYAGAAIRSAIKRAIATKASIIHVPEYLNALISQGATEGDATQHGECLRDALAVRGMRKISESTLDVPLDMIVYARDDDGHEARNEAQATASALLATLPPTEAAVLRLRFGFGDHEPHSQDEVASVIGTTRGIARRTEIRALNRLREQMGVAG